VNLSEVISSGLLESYVLGTSTAEETALINELCKKYPELVKEIEAIEAGLISLSAQAGRSLDPALKKKITTQLAFEEALQNAPAKVIPLQKTENNKIKFYQFAVAASLLLFVTSFIYNVLLQKQLRAVNGELAQLSASKSYMAEALTVQQASMEILNTKFQVVSDPKIKTVALNGMNYLAKNSAAIHWNTATNEVYFNASQLPESPANKQYQLWAIVAGKPVDAGMIDLSNASPVFQKMKSVEGAQAFAVTIENAGGSVSPTMETMCLLGNV
jgi:anti-sigma-K factor RskA